MKIYIKIMFIIFLFYSCQSGEKKISKVLKPLEFNPNVFDKNLVSTRVLKGQLIYLPVYSNTYNFSDTSKFDMSAFIAIHNTDLYNKIKIIQVLYFNNDGILVNDYLNKKEVVLNPLATKDFYIPYEDKSGIGANFLVEWRADTLVNEPLVESVTISVKPNQSVAVLSHGRIIGEYK